MTNTDEARAFWTHYRGQVQMIARLDWKSDEAVGLYPVEVANDESGLLYARINIPGRGFFSFGPAMDRRSLTRLIIEWGRAEGARWEYRSPGSFIPEDLHGELQVRDITNSQLAERIGVSDHKVREWVAGRGEPTRAEMERICEVLGIFPTDLERR